MTIFTGEDDVLPTPSVMDLKSSLGEGLGTTFGEGFMSGARQIAGIGELAGAEHAGERYVPAEGEGTFPSELPLPPMGTFEKLPGAAPDLPIATAKSKVTEAGLDHILKLPDQPAIKPGVLDIMLTRARHENEVAATMARGPQGVTVSALNAATALAAGAVDPLNIAAALIPGVPEAQAARLMAAAGRNVIARAGARAALGAAQGAEFSAAMVPLDWYAKSQEGQDFTAGTALRQILLGAATFGAIHPVAGGGADIVRAWRGRPLYPFASGDAHDRFTTPPAAPGEAPGQPLREAAQAPEPPADDAAARGAPASGEARAEGASARATGAPEPGGPQPRAGGGLEGDVEELFAPPAGPLDHAIGDLPANVQTDNLRMAIARMTSGEPVDVAETLQELAKTDPRIAESLALIEAFHGSPHDFERFDISKMGEGEGAQSYGHGLYFAENERVARSYRKTTSDRAFVRKAQELYGEFDTPADAHEAVADSKDFTPAEKRLLQALEKDDWLGFDYPHQAVSAALREPKAYELSPETIEALADIGNIYKVRINASQEHFLDWDKPLKEQPENVRRALQPWADREIEEIAKARYAERDGGEPVNVTRLRAQLESGDVLARELYHRQRSLPEASRELSAAGVPGIKYFDRGSRRGGEGTRNFVVFNDKDIEITHKNGEVVWSANDPGLLRPRGGPAARDERTWSLFEFLAARGGLKPDPELAAIFGGRNPFVPGFGPLLRQGGMTLDHAREASVEADYLHDAAQEHGGVTESTINHLLEALDLQARGTKVYRAGNEAGSKAPGRADHLDELEHEMHGALVDAGINPASEPDKRLARVLQIMDREGVHDPVAAYERAVMEEDRNAIDRGHAEPHGPVPGWDVPDDRGAAPGAGRKPARPGTARPGEGPRQRGGADRAAVEQALWRKLAAAAEQRDPDAAAALAAQHAAEKLPVPESTQAEIPDGAKPGAVSPATQDAMRAAADADAMWANIEPYMTPEERESFATRIAAAEQDSADRTEVARRGAACLTMAVG